MRVLPAALTLVLLLSLLPAQAIPSPADMKRMGEANEGKKINSSANQASKRGKG